MKKRCLTAAMLAAFLATSASADLPGPIPAEVVRVIDGDTTRARANIWLGQWKEINVRLADVDAPELRARCDDERYQALAAKEYVEAILTGSEAITLHEIRQDKWGGRVVARIEADGLDLGEMLLAEGLAREYDGGAREGWC